MRPAVSAPRARASASGSACASFPWRAVASTRSACRQSSDPLLAGAKAASELSQPLSAIPRCNGSGLGPSRRGACAGARAGIQAAALPAARERGEVQGGKAKRERAGAVVAAGAGDLLLPDIEEAVVVIAPALGLAHGASIAEAAPRR